MNQYPQSVIEQWQKGAEQFNTFLNLIKDKQDNLEKKELDAIQALLLGEKPAIFGFETSEEYKKELLSIEGIKKEGDFFYNEEKVRDIMNLYPDIFQDFIDKPIEELMKFLDTYRGSEDLKRGLVLGFPKEACESYEKLQNVYDEANKLEEKYPQYLGAGFNEKYIPMIKIISDIPTNLDILPEIERINKTIQTLQENEISQQYYGLNFVHYGASEVSEEVINVRQRLHDAFEMAKKSIDF